jgi:hypothetical protein
MFVVDGYIALTIVQITPSEKRHPFLPFGSVLGGKKDIVNNSKSLKDSFGESLCDVLSWIAIGTPKNLM